MASCSLFGVCVVKRGVFVFWSSKEQSMQWVLLHAKYLFFIARLDGPLFVLRAIENVVRLSKGLGTWPCIRLSKEKSISPHYSLYLCPLPWVFLYAIIVDVLSLLKTSALAESLPVVNNDTTHVSPGQSRQTAIQWSQLPGRGYVPVAAFKILNASRVD